ncbi:MAG: ATP-binding cassette domain-containing protein [Spirochaetia bacterium]
MALLGIQSLTHGFGGPPLLDGVDLHIEEGDRLCLLGSNGCGKSTLLKIMAGLLEPDGGTITRQSGIKTSYLGQVLPQNMSGNALDIASEEDQGRMLEAERLLTLFGIDPQREGLSLSGGEMRRVLLSQALSAEPDLLLLDEPTNHLDIDTILWLEEYLRRRVKTFLFVTHDRSFARHLANRVGELDRGKLYVFPTGYDEFIRRREELLEAEKKARAEFDKKLAQEEAWLRRGLKARRTRNEGRVRDLLEMREQYRQRREKSGTADMEIHDGGRSGKKVIEAKHITFGYGEHLLVKDFSTTVLRGDRVGIVGPNGSGKTTLVKLLLGEIAPDEGTLRMGTKVKPIYFDQLRSELDPDKTVLENLGGGAQTIELNGRKKHILGYLQDFLFSPERAKSPVSHLSGGEHNRLLLAKLFARPVNLIVLDEPTNDLDIETLELLEDILFEYRGTLLLVSHDREFLDNVVTETFVLDGTGRVIEYAGGYGDWRAQEEQRRKEEKAAAGGGKSVGRNGKDNSGGSGRTSRPRKISYKERQELEKLPGTIEKLEEEKEQLHALLANPDLYRSGAAKTGGTNKGTHKKTSKDETPELEPSEAVARLEELEKELEHAYERWEFLESLPG